MLENGDYVIDSETFVGGELTIEPAPEEPEEDNPNTTDNAGAAILWTCVSLLTVCMLAAVCARIIRRKRFAK